MLLSRYVLDFWTAKRLRRCYKIPFLTRGSVSRLLRTWWSPWWRFLAILAAVVTASFRHLAVVIDAGDDNDEEGGVLLVGRGVR